MGKRGPAKTPTAKLEKLGSWRAKVREDEPVYGEVTATRAPSGLGYHGKKIWNRVFPMLANQGVLTDVDLTAFERYCFLWQKWKDESVSDNFDLNKLMKIEAGFSRLEQQFGLTPASRPNVKATSKVDNSGKKDYFKVG